MKKVYAALLATALLIALPLSVSAEQTQPEQAPQSIVNVQPVAIRVTPVSVVREKDTSTSRKDVIETKYLVTADGKWYYRDWNVTRNRWEDAYWIPM